MDNFRETFSIASSRRPWANDQVDGKIAEPSEKLTIFWYRNQRIAMGQEDLAITFKIRGDTTKGEKWLIFR